MNLSYWEQKSWFSNVDFTVVGSGIVGLNCAMYLKQNYPKAKVLMVERGVFPQGASTKNAGFACFGSLSEIIGDLNSHSEQEVVDLVKKRWQGLQLLRKNLGDSKIAFQQNGGYELFTDRTLFDECYFQKERINKLLAPIFNENVFLFQKNQFGFDNIENQYSFNAFEGQIDTGAMMRALLYKVQSLGVQILNNLEVCEFEEYGNNVLLKTKQTEFKTNKLFIATNGFAKQLLNENIEPARAQILITKPINNLNIKGTFHLERGYYYFRNIDNRVLLGGGRNLDFKSEETTKFGQTVLVQNKLTELLNSTILPNSKFEIDYAWSGIMGVGNQKNAIVKQLSNNVFCGVRLGGMGVAIGSTIGKDLVELL